jgi:hypothetical protein
MTETFSLDSHFTGKEPIVRAIYDRLLASLRKFGKIIEEPKKTSIHLVNASALAGVETRKTYILLNIKADHNLNSPRVNKVEQVSANRIHHRVKLSSLDDIDKELLGWLHDAYALSG